MNMIEYRQKCDEIRIYTVTNCAHLLFIRGCDTQRQGSRLNRVKKQRFIK